MSEYTPATEQVRRDYAYNWNTEHVDADFEAGFDRWLTDHDAATRTAALEEAAVIAEQHSAHSGHCSGCDMALVIAATIRSEKVAES